MENGTPDSRNNDPRHGKGNTTPNLFTDKANIIAIYSILAILVKMKHTLGLEAMVEYMEKYLTAIGSHNPGMKSAVAHALKLMSVEKIYNELVRSDMG